jgi:alcohol dehydrogenase (cytochrome c)
MKLAPERVKLTHGQLYVGSGSAAASPTTHVTRALDAATGKMVWEYPSPEGKDGGTGGLLATQGDLVLGCSGGEMFALDSKTGVERWKVGLGGVSVGTPISVNIEGAQTILVAAGHALFAFTL